MAHHAEPMDIDSDFDNKENSLHHNNVLPFTEKGYEELDVSELNMKLRYSTTPASSPMSKSYTACVDNRSLESGDDTLVTINENSNLTRSLNSNMTKNDNIVKSLKALPLQAISTEQFGDNNRSSSVLRSLDTTVIQDNANITVTVSGSSDIDENSLLSSSSSAVPTPEATTPTKDNLKNDGGSSPIMRGIKTVLNMFRSSQSPIPPADNEDIVKPDILSPVEATLSTEEAKSQAMLASTPISTHRKKETSPTKRNSPHKESIIFNEDLEKELQWKDETTIIFSQERIPIHKLFLQHPQTEIKNNNQNLELPTREVQDDMNSTVEYMDISYNDSFRDRTMSDCKTDCTFTGESDAEFVDCETTFTKNDSLLEDKDKTPMNDETQGLDLTEDIESTNENSSASRLKQIILNTTQDILDATLSITPEDLLPEALLKTQNEPRQDNNILDQVLQTENTVVIPSEIALDKVNETINLVLDETLENSITSQENLSTLNQTVDVMRPSVDKSEESNVTATFENVVQPILDQTVEITNSVMNTEYKEEPNVTKIIEKISSDTVTFDSEHNILEYSDSTSSSETLVPNEKKIVDLRIHSTNHNEHNLIQDITQDIEPNKTGLDTTNISEHNSTELAETTNTTIYNPGTLEEIVNKSLLNPDDEGKSITITEPSMTELAAEVPLPDEDDLEKELSTPADETDASTLPHSLPLDLVDNIKVETEITEMIHNLTLEKEKQIMEVEGNNEYKTVLPQPLNTTNFETSIQNKTLTLDQEIIKEGSEVIQYVDVKNEKPPLTEQPQVANIDVLPETAPSLNIDTKTDQVQHDIIKDVDAKHEKPLLTEEPQVATVDVLPETAPSLNIDTKTDQVRHDVIKDVYVKNEKPPLTEEPQVATVDVLPETAPSLNIDTKTDQVRHDVIKDVDVKNEKPPLTEEPQVATVDELPETAPSLNIDTKTDKVQHDVIKDVDVKNEKPPLTEEPQVATVDELPETAPSLNIDTKTDKVQHDVIIDVDVKNEKPPLTEEPQVVTVDVLPETAPSLNIDTKTDNKADQVQHDVGVLNQTETVTECLNATVTLNSEENLRLSQPMDINESVIGLKPLPDIINQTNIVSNGENLESAENIPELVMIEQHANVPENVKLEANAVISSETVPEAAHNVVPELLSDVSEIAKHANELTKVIREELPITPTNDEIAKDSVTESPATIPTEDIPVATDGVTVTQLNYVDVIPTDLVIPDNENQPIHTNVPISESADIKTEDDEIILSENNSPFVSVIAEDIPGMKSEENIDVQTIEHRLATAGKAVFTPPASPPIASKGYNFNFDEMDDPFATKTKIRMSPSVDTPTKAVESELSSRSVEKPMPKKETMNRRKSQPERKKTVAPKRKFNSTFSGAVTEKIADRPVEKSAVGDVSLEPPPSVALEVSNVTIEDKLIEEAKIVHERTLSIAKEAHKLEQELNPTGEVEQPVITSSAEFIETDESATLLSKDSKSTSSSEQSAYYSARTSSNDSFHSRNVFNIPEIDDKNFNPFATKSKMRQSPPPNLDMESPFATKSKIRSSPDSSMILPQNDEVNTQDITKVALLDDKMETEFMEKDSSGNLSNTTTSSKGTDEKSGTIKEVHTEDEDTIEGPFLEAEDLNTDDKMSDFDGENIDMMHFHDLPTQANDENGELFIDAEAFEFLLNQNKSNTVVDSGKESLFLKFDPLFAKRMSSITAESLVASLNKIQKRQSTPTKATMPESEVKSPKAGPSNLNITQDMDMTHNSSEEFNEDLNITVAKPMMVVPPAVNPVTPRNKPLTPNRSNRRSLTFTSPAMAVIDRLLSLSGNSSLLHDTTVTHATREQNEADLALTQLRELLAEKEINVYSLRSESRELKDRLTSLESHLKSLEEESQDRLQKINDLNNRLAEKTKINKSMAAVVEEYERTIASLISETAQDKKRHAEERIKLINERDEQTAHLASMEVSFSDLHSKYEKSKQVILNCKANEDIYTKSIKEFKENLTKMQNNYELLKQHATSKLNHANQELEKMNRTHEAEVLKLNAMIKRKELHVTSLEESLAQKTKANEELTAICDELINKVG